MATIAEQFLGAYEPPKMMNDKYENSGLTDVSNYLKSKQVISLTQDELKQLAADKDSWFKESNITEFNNLEKSSKYSSDHNFTIIDKDYGISDYIGGYEKYLPSMYYLWWAKKNNENVTINVYDAFSLTDINKRNQILRDKIIGMRKALNKTTEEDRIMYNVNPYDFDFKTSIIKYTRFVESKYVENVTIPSLKNPATIISVNLPLAMYCVQPLPPNIYNYDIDKKVFTFGTYSANDFDEFLHDLAHYGITEPLFMRMNGQFITSTDERTMLTLFAAILLKIPSIPVNIYFTDESFGSNELMEELFKLGYYDRKLYNGTSYMDFIFAPNIVIRETNYRGSMEINNSPYPLSTYTEFNSDKYISIRKYDPSKANDSTLKSNSEEVENLIKKNLEDINNKVTEEINSVIKKLKSDNE
jgi:hypothetical protein